MMPLLLRAQSACDSCWTFHGPGDIDGSLNYIDALALDSTGNIWLGGADDDRKPLLCRFDGEEWERIDLDEWGLNGWDIGGIAVDADNTLWLTCYNKVIHWKGGAERQVFAIDAALRPCFLRLAVAPDGDVWVNALNRGLYRLRGGRFDQIWGRDSTEESQEWNIDDLRFDRDGALWVAARNGLWKREGESLVRQKSNGRQRDEVGSVAFDAGGVLWFCGLGHRTLNRVDSSTWTTYLSIGDWMDRSEPVFIRPAHTYQPSRVVVLPGGEVIVGSQRTHSMSLWRSGVWHRILRSDRECADVVALAPLLVDRRGRVWCSAMTQKDPWHMMRRFTALAVYDPSGDAPTPDSMSIAPIVRSLHSDPDPDIVEPALSTPGLPGR